MPRIRSIFPGLFTDDEFMALTVSAPLAVPLLLGLWTMADDQGVFEWKPLTIKARILPAVAVDVEELLAELVARRFIRRFEAGGRSYGAIRNFRKWQRPKKPNAVHPLPEEVREYVGLEAGDSPTGGEPVPNQSGKVSAEVGGRLEEVGGKKPTYRDIARGPDHGITWPVPEEPPPWAVMEAQLRGIEADDVPEVYTRWRDLRMANGIAPFDPVADWRAWCSGEVKRRRQGIGPPRAASVPVADVLALAKTLKV